MPVSERAGPAIVQSDPRVPLTRLTGLLDVGSIVPLTGQGRSGVLTVRGRIDGAMVIAFCTDATRMGGALGLETAERIVEAIDAAIRDRLPVIGVWHSGGAKIADGVESMHGVGRMFSAITRASGRIPQLSIVVGPAAGAAAYGPALTDFVVMAPAGRMFINGPDVVRKVTGEEIDLDGLGGAHVHGSMSGVAHVVAPSEDEAYAVARQLTSLFTQPGIFDLSAAAEGRDPSTHVPASAKHGYDVRPVVRTVVDAEPDFLELQPFWAPNITIGLGRLTGRTVGVVASNPAHNDGWLDSLAAEKAARFVRLCDAFGVPLVAIADTPGVLPGVGQERDGVVRRGAKLLHAFADAVVPRVTLVIRKAFGGAYIAMNSRSLGATRVLSWPGTQIAVMSAEAAVEVLYRKQLAAVSPAQVGEARTRLVAEHERACGVGRAVETGVVDEIVEPKDTRVRLASALAAAAADRGHNRNIPI